MAALKKTGYKVIAVILIQLFFVSNMTVFAADFRDPDEYDQENRQSSDYVNTEIAMLDIPANAFFSTNTSSSDINSENNIEYSVVVDGLDGCDLKTKCNILKASGATATEAAIALVGDDNNAQDIVDGLTAVGYSRDKVANFLSNIIDKQNNSNDTKIQANVDSSNSDITEITTSIDDEQVTSDDQEPQINTALISNVADSQNDDQLLTDQESIQTNYQNLLDEGLQDAEIISQLKSEGFSAVEILQAATELDRDMIEVAGGMLSAGYSNVDVAGAFIAKASNWVVDTTINIVNCAAQSLAEIISGQESSDVSLVDLAYEIIVSDILSQGEVIINDSQIMSSMQSIKEIAAEEGLSLEGYNADISDLEGVNDKSIVHLDNNHWATVTDISDDSVTVLDNGKEVTMSREEFQSRWDGNALISTDEQISKNALSKDQMTQIKGAWSLKKAFKSAKKAVKRAGRSVKKGIQKVRDEHSRTMNKVHSKAAEHLGIDEHRDSSNFFAKLHVGSYDSVTMFGEGTNEYVDAWGQALQGNWSDAWDTVCVAQYKFNGHASNVWMNTMSEDDAREVGKVVKPIVVAVCTVIGGYLGGEEGAAIGSFCGVLISSMFDYDMMQSAKQDDSKQFMENFEKVVANAVVAAVATYCCSWASDTLGNWFSGSETAGSTASSTTASTTTASTGQVIGSATQQAVTNSATSYALNYAMDEAGIDNPYIRAAINGVVCSYATANGWTIDSETAESLVSGCLSALSKEAVVQEGERQGWNEAVTTVLSSVVGGLVSTTVEAGFEKYNTQDKKAENLNKAHGTEEGKKLLAQYENAENGIHKYGSFDESKPTMLFIHGATGDPANFAMYVENYKEDYNIVFYKYTEKDTLNHNSDYLNSEWIKFKSENNVDDAVIVQHSYGHTVFRNAALRDDKKTYKTSKSLALNPLLGGVASAEGNSTGLSGAFVSVTPYESLVDAVDPLGDTNNTLYNDDNLLEFNAKVRSNDVIMVTGDHHGPQPDSDPSFVEISDNAVDATDQDFHLQQSTNHAHTETLVSETSLDVFDLLLKNN